MPELTVDDARTFLASVGIVLPDVLLTLFVARANTVLPCLELNYDPTTVTLILLYLVGMFGVVAGDRYVTSQSAPSGASQSYRYGTLTERYKSNLSLLQSLDSFGCTTPLIPALPGASAGLWLGRGGCDVTDC